VLRGFFVESLQSPNRADPHYLPRLSIPRSLSAFTFPYMRPFPFGTRFPTVFRNDVAQCVNKKQIPSKAVAAWTDDTRPGGNSCLLVEARGIEPRSDRGQPWWRLQAYPSF
jgi:hypothetical protein